MLFKIRYSNTIMVIGLLPLFQLHQLFLSEENLMHSQLITCSNSYHTLQAKVNKGLALVASSGVPVLLQDNFRCKCASMSSYIMESKLWHKLLCF